jgi:hypothetical protein
MTAPTDEFVEIGQRTQKAVTTAVRTWTDTLQRYAGSITAEHPLPTTADALAVVDSWYDLAQQLVSDQRAVATALVTRGHDAVSTFAEQAGAVTTALTEQARTATAGAAEAARNGVGRPA